MPVCFCASKEECKRREMRSLNRIISLALIGFSSLIIFQCLQLGVGKPGNPKTGFMPFLVSVLLFSISLLILIMEIKRPDEAESGSPLIIWKNLVKPVYLIVILCGYTFLLTVFGYLVATFLLVLSILSISGPKKWCVNMVIAAVASNLSFLLFYKGLGVLLPVGIFHISF
jgi:hypothetical protein